MYYAFLVSEVHPFDDGNGRLSRLVMNSELTIGYMTAHAVHHGRAGALLITRQASLDAAFLAHPNRFKNRKPQPHGSIQFRNKSTKDY